MADFYLDEPVADVLVDLLRPFGHDVVATRQIGNKGSRDFRQHLFATRSGRTLITYDLRDYPMLHEAWRQLAREWQVGVPILHPGILIIPPPTRLAIAAAARVIDELVGQNVVANRLLAWKVPTGWAEIL